MRCLVVWLEAFAACCRYRVWYTNRACLGLLMMIHSCSNERILPGLFSSITRTERRVCRLPSTTHTCVYVRLYLACKSDMYGVMPAVMRFGSIRFENEHRNQQLPVGGPRQVGERAGRQANGRAGGTANDIIRSVCLFFNFVFCHFGLWIIPSILEDFFFFCLD